MINAALNDHFLSRLVAVLELSHGRLTNLWQLSFPLFAITLASSAWAQPSTVATFSRVVVPSAQTEQERAITAMLVEEAAHRTASGISATIEPGVLADVRTGNDVVVLATADKVPGLLPRSLQVGWNAACTALHPAQHAESYTIIGLRWHSKNVTVVAGADQRGELFGAGWLLRHMSFSRSTPHIPAGVHLYSAPDKPVRGQQIGYRAKNNTYDAWNLAQFEQHIRELAIFGNNTIQLISPKSDDAASSPLFPAPALETVVGISAILEKYGLDCDLYYPELRQDYTDNATVAAELAEFEALVRAMPRIDSIHIPGGDPGHTPPEILFPLIAREAEVLHRYHPRATVWVSGQGFDRARYAAFYSLLDARPAWLTGVFFGPQSRDSFATQRRRIPQQLPMQFYPDIAHTMHAQFPVPRWDPVFALTEGREPICPRPAAFAAIYRRFDSLHDGFITYSEGVNDHVNQIVWDQLGWSSKTSVHTILSEYARFFLRREGAQQALAVRAIQGLEENWHGPLASNSQIPRTLHWLEVLDDSATPGQTAHNGHWESLLYRANYDASLQGRLLRERRAESEALTVLGSLTRTSEERAEAARETLINTRADTRETLERERVFTLARKLFEDYGIQLSVPLYGASNWERGANLDRIDTPLTDAAWLNHAIDEALAGQNEDSRIAALEAIIHWQHPSPGSLYDDLGDPAAEPHLVRGEGWDSDPEMYHTAIDGIADRTLAADNSPGALTGAPTQPSAEDPWRFSWLTYAETLYETPLELAYTHLDPRRSWHVRVTYAGEDYALPLRLVANNGIEIHPARLRHSNPETVEFPIPPAAVASGTLRLRWVGPEGSGGSGRGRQVAEVWLLPQ